MGFLGGKVRSYKVAENTSSLHNIHQIYENSRKNALGVEIAESQIRDR